MEEIATCEGKGEGRGAGEGEKEEESGPPLSLRSVRDFSSCKRLTQPFHASESIQFPHPNSNRIHGNLSTSYEDFYLARDGRQLRGIENASYPTVAN